MNRTLNRWFPRSLEIASSESQKLLGEMNHDEYLRLLALAQRAAAAATPQASGSNHDSAIESAARLAASQGAEGVWATDAKGAILPVASPLASPLTLDPLLKSFASSAAAANFGRRTPAIFSPRARPSAPASW